LLKSFHQTTNLMLNDIMNVIETLDLLDPMQVEEFLKIPDENIVYEVLSNDKIISILVETFRTNNSTTTDMEDVKDEDNNLEILLVNANTAN
ncbi:4607_t:CDS:1, partial [Cetraspora pellucida]